MTTAKSFGIEWEDCRADDGYETVEAAEAAVRAEYPNAEIGHLDDLSEGGRFTMCWRSSAPADAAVPVAVICRKGARTTDFEPDGGAAEGRGND